MKFSPDILFAFKYAEVIILLDEECKSQSNRNVFFFFSA